MHKHGKVHGGMRMCMRGRAQRPAPTQIASTRVRVGRRVRGSMRMCVRGRARRRAPTQMRGPTHVQRQGGACPKSSDTCRYDP